MKMREATILILSFVVVFFIGLSALKTSPSGSPRIHLTSYPFPAIAGPTTFYTAVTNPDGTKITGATIDLNASMMMEGMLPTHGRAAPDQKGWYSNSFTFGMMGEYVVDVTATLPDKQVVRDTFNIYVYPVQQMKAAGETVYRSQREIEADRSTNSSRERWIIIPLGTQALLRNGQGDNVIPSELHLSVTGQNTLVIRNDDIADHKVGPFFIRAGETIRQEFRTAAEFVGTCTIRHGSEVSIIVS